MKDFAAKMQWFNLKKKHTTEAENIFAMSYKVFAVLCQKKTLALFLILKNKGISFDKKARKQG